MAVMNKPFAYRNKLFEAMNLYTPEGIHRVEQKRFTFFEFASALPNCSTYLRIGEMT